MNERFFSEESNKEPILEFNLFTEAAIDSGLKVKLPLKGTEAYIRLFGLCKRYSNAVHSDVTGKSGEGFATGRERREVHNELCKMLYGTEYDKTNGDKIMMASNFAHLVAGRDQYIT
ncbi:MAG: hypothetical protein NTZ13_03815 [Candidatus Parcubacteria bacterium]|nr:hypothetical protein [Candidatus Parcubacteria bacterium]